MDWKNCQSSTRATLKKVMYGTNNSPRKSTIIGLWPSASEQEKHISPILQSIDLVLACGHAHSPCLWVREVEVDWPSLSSADNCFLILFLHIHKMTQHTTSNWHPFQDLMVREK